MARTFDFIIIGAGHAGCEAAVAAARMGVRTALVTMDLRAVARMSCNPAIGGLAKGHLVREVDALGGVMAIATDNTGIQFRMLNTGKGPAVRAPRAQCDKAQYSAWMAEFLKRVPNLTLVEGMADEVLFRSGTVAGLVLRDGTRLDCRAILFTTGTFLDGLIHIGLRNFSAGRIGEQSADKLSRSLKDLGLRLGRLKTGTPPRLAKESVDFSVCQPQHGDDPPQPFSFTTKRVARRQIPMHLTYTNAETHRIIRDNLDKSPMYCGVIKGIGPRYCPSIEDKVVRFADRDRHQIFLEPEGYDAREIYVNGVSTSLPEEVQERFVRTIPGLERAEFLRPGYAVEYTYVLPAQCDATLGVRGVTGLYLAGQICGTSGYEEAAAQGLMAGINAALWLRGEPPFVLRRDEAYIGVLLDDLITKDHTEPYRMFTSRAEFRLLLRQDNADLRLTEYGRKLGLIDDARWEAFCRYRKSIERERARLDSTFVKASDFDNPTATELGLLPPDKAIPLSQLLSRPEVKWEDLAAMNWTGDLDDPRAIEQVALDCKYRGYLRKQEEQVERMHRQEEQALPDEIDYRGIRGLRREAADKLQFHRPRSLGQASRIAGVNPSDLTLLMIHLKARARAKAA
ncbi:MAG: tRNA uridine-5-carboxymethylaminomethyl(34) synthesis enzyme MnmG [bacterium]